MADVYDAVTALDGRRFDIVSVQFQHRLGQVVTALADAGLRIDFLNELDFDAFQRFGGGSANRAGNTAGHHYSR